MCYNFATFVLYLDVITLIYRENRLTSSETCLSAEPIGQNRTVSGQKPTNQRFVGFCPLTLLFCSVGSAERQGFEPREPLGSTVFKTAAIDHSAIFPICCAIKRFV